MLCEKCHKREAKVYYTEIIGGEKKEQYLCETCASQYTSFQIEKAGVDGGLSGLLSSILSNYYGEKKTETAEKTKTTACPHCGITYEEVQKAGKLGCAQCYKSFGEIIERTLRQIQGADTHIGKSPADKKPVRKEDGAAARETQENTITAAEKLAFLLQEAIEQEEFEEAARLRDEIRELNREETKDA